jgi:hypothetical protein
MTEYEIDEALSFNFEFSSVSRDGLDDGFNEYGVRERDDGSIDVIFSAMEPGLRKGVRITPEFLETVVENFNNSAPMQLDHSTEQMQNVGQITDARFRGDLRLRGHIPNTGSSVRSDVIADFTHDPPAITDGSVGFEDDFELTENDSGEPEFVDATLNEFSLTPFPAGYDDGGLSPRFAEAAREAGVFDVENTTDDTGTSHLKGRNQARFHEI